MTEKVSGWWISSSQNLQPLIAEQKIMEPTPVLLFIHGSISGGSAISSPEFSLEFLPRLQDAFSKSSASVKNYAIFAPHYPLAPEATYDDQVDAITKAYLYLSQHTSVGKISILADSSGTALALSLCQLLGKDPKIPYPEHCM